MKLIYYIVFTIWYLLSLLPLRLLYLLSDFTYFLLYYLIRYRRKVVRNNLTASFPEKNEKEIIQIEKKFYAWFCDYVVETLKEFSMSKEQMMKRMTFSGIDDIIAAMEKEDKNFCFVYLGHYGNWEWIASLAYWCPDTLLCGQIYHPLKNKAFDRLFLRVREQFGGVCIPMKETLRKIIEMRRSKQKAIIGFISDQAPKWNSIHHWCDFFHRETPVFIGTEKIGKQVDALIYYADVTRPKRGYYHCSFKPMTHQPKQVPDYELTDQFTHLLEEMITAAPFYWLWTHKRWKRTKEEWIRRQKEHK
ncbi:MAG: lysophospholipid acyltransferase family protein [Bacteroides sp.]|nr:lysophospholipid acyltransferase family protein [Bacteroides sp.]